MSKAFGSKLALPAPETDSSLPWSFASAFSAVDSSLLRASVRAAMEYAFGDKFVCDSLQTARATANHKDVQKKCVTMDGDLVDPSGTMTGGSSGSLGSCLSKLTQLGEAQKELGAAEERLALEQLLALAMAECTVATMALAPY